MDVKLLLYATGSTSSMVRGDGLWAKQDPARIDLDMPGNIKSLFAEYRSVFERYGKVIYGLYAPGQDREGTEECPKLFLI